MGNRIISEWSVWRISLSGEYSSECDANGIELNRNWIDINIKRAETETRVVLLSTSLTIIIMYGYMYVVMCLRNITYIFFLRFP